GLDAEAAKEKLEIALNALAITTPELALKQAEADNAAVVQYLENSKKNPQMVVDARIRAESAARMLAFGRAGLDHAKAQAEKPAADQRLAEATAAVAAPKAAADAAAKAAAESKVKAETAKKAVEEAKKKLESVTAEPDKKAAEEALKKLEVEQTAAAQAAQSAEAARAAAAAAAEASAKKLADAGAAATAAGAALTQTKAALDAAVKAIADGRTAAEAAIKAADAAKTAALPKRETAKKAEEAAQGAVDIAKANLESAKGRVEKAKESVVAVEKSIQEANKRLEEQKAEQTKLDVDRKAAADALVKAKLNVRTGGFSTDSSFVLLGGEDGKVYAFGADRGAEAGVAPAHEKPVVAIGGAGVSIGADGSMRAGTLLPKWKLQLVMEPGES